MRELEKTLKELANRRRLAIIKFLKKQGEKSVGDIAHEINLSFKSTSKHLGVLSAVDIVDREQRSLQMFYRIAKNQKPAAKHIISLL